MIRAWPSVGTAVVMPSIKALSSGILLSQLNLRPCATPDGASKMTYMVTANNISEIVHPVAIPTWRSVHSFVNVEIENLSKMSEMYCLNIDVIS